MPPPGEPSPVPLPRVTRADPARRPVLISAALALVVRVGWVLYAAREPVGLVDPTFYRAFGITIAAGDGYLGFFSHQPSAYFPPGYPYAVGLATWFQHHLPLPSVPVTVGLVQALLGMAMTLAIASVALRWWGTRAAWVAGLVLALWPNLVIHSAVLLSETLYLALLCVTLWCATEVGHAAVATGRRTRRTALWVGGTAVAFGASVLVRPQGALCGLVLVVMWWSAGRRQLVVRLAAVGAITVAVAAPWLIRNHDELGSAVMSTNVGDNLCIGNGPDATGRFRLGNDCATEHDYIDDTRSEVLHDEEATAVATGEVRRHPVRQVRLVPTRLWATVVDDHDGLRAAESFGNDPWMPGGLRTLLRWTSDIYWYLMAIAAGVSLLQWARRRWFQRERQRSRPHLICAVGLITALMAPLISFGEPRFKIPAIPFLVLLVAGLVGPRSSGAERGGPDGHAEPQVGT